MAIYLALLRGINVGGHNMIKMPELRRMLEEMGLARVQTYIQSGNVVFVSDDEVEQLQIKIEAEILRVFNLSVPVVLRRYEELKNIIQSCPFTDDALAEGESIHVFFMRDAPSSEVISRLGEIHCPPDQFQVKGREIYIFFRQSIRDSKLPSKLEKLGVTVTARNWRTVTKLAALAEAIEE